MESFDKIKQQLLSLREEYTKRIEAIQIDSHHKEEPVEKDFAEQATQRENDDVLAALDDEAQHMVLQIDTALSQIEQGGYGICTSCGEAIPHDRLQAAPFVTLCIRCAEKTSS
ncbi:MAG: TraR/DksA family transcriptional regulator [Gammaproteobacteria bacterium]|nr:TraR/DksA family transcriptional regulator [Gammaproteobacteria bacterium]MCW8923753.1 TraR/DksA family transcriptional regulator [Gammaproteobacteria bacterium]